MAQLHLSSSEHPPCDAAGPGEPDAPPWRTDKALNSCFAEMSAIPRDYDPGVCEHPGWDRAVSGVHLHEFVQGWC